MDTRSLGLDQRWLPWRNLGLIGPGPGSHSNMHSPQRVRRGRTESPPTVRRNGNVVLQHKASLNFQVNSFEQNRQKSPVSGLRARRLFCFETSNCSQNFWMDWNSAMLCFQLFHIGVGPMNVCPI